MIMPRKTRMDAPGALHHVIIRGMERRKIFRSDDERLNLVSRLWKLVPETNTDCLACAILDKHVHLLFRTGTVRLSMLMSRLLTRYADWFNINTAGTGSYSRTPTNRCCASRMPTLRNCPVHPFESIEGWAGEYSGGT